MDAPTLEWLRDRLTYRTPRDYFRGERVVEVGSMNVNGSIRATIEGLGVGSYRGYDIYPGPGVDEVLSVHDLTRKARNVGVVVSTEALEHIEDWRDAVDKLKAAVKPGGLVVLTTRRPGFPLHNYPEDYWRFTEAMLREAFRDFYVIHCEEIRGQGVGIIAHKPLGWTPGTTLDFEPVRAPLRPQGRLRRRLWLIMAYRLGSIGA